MSQENVDLVARRVLAVSTQVRGYQAGVFWHENAEYETDP